MSSIKDLYRKKETESWLLEMFNGDTAILDFAKGYIELFEEYAESLEGTEHYLIEAKLAKKLDDGKLTKLFKAAAAISRGQPGESSLIQDFKANTILKKFKRKIERDIQQYQNAEPYANYDIAMNSIIKRYKQILHDGNHEAIKLSNKLYDYGNNHQEHTKFIAGIMSTLASVADQPYFKVIAVPVLKEIIDTLKKIE